MANRPTPAWPFGAHDYQIEYAPRQATIRARAARPLRVGDRYTIERQDCLYELVVEDISRVAGGQWSARCSVADSPW